MFISVLCHTCGTPIGDIAPLFTYEAAERENAEKEKAVLDGVPAPDTDNTELFESLGIMSNCCRMNIVTMRTFPMLL
jgi:DNA-directed RNA polymerase subunit N (RpoN/RPB10)